MRRIIAAFLIVAGALAWRGVSPAVASDPETRLILAPATIRNATMIRRIRQLSCCRSSHGVNSPPMFVD